VNRETNEKDIPASVAIVGLAALAGAWLYFKAPAAVSLALNELDRYAEANLAMIGIIFFATTINSIWVYSVFSRSLGINRQGQRLEILAKENLRKRKTGGRLPWMALTSSLVVTPALYFFVERAALTTFPSFVPKRFFVPIWATLAVDLGFSLFVILGAAERGGWFEKLLGNSGQRLPEMPLPKNAIVLGAVEEIVTSE
jgi:hypothetical protein